LKKKNIFLTGSIKVGKSTLINRLLEDFKGSVKGFKTLPYFKEDEKSGFLLKGFNVQVEPSGLPLICRRTKTGILYGIIETFEGYGVRILQECLETGTDLILMDELGIFETGAQNFQKWVLKCLDSHIPVLGVIKPKSTAFLEGIKKRKDVTIIEVDLRNRDMLYGELKDIFG